MLAVHPGTTVSVGHQVSDLFQQLRTFTASTPQHLPFYSTKRPDRVRLRLPHHDRKVRLGLAAAQERVARLASDRGQDQNQDRDQEHQKVASPNQRLRFDNYISLHSQLRSCPDHQKCRVSKIHSLI